ncbi:MAG: hypothetical protein KDA78_14015 [Planctomycetaceae bacterium]|nr:hypothetical protein [Planctomycetaceae bacterium]
MAQLLVDENGNYLTECPLCDKTLAQPIFATTHFIEDPADKLWAYSDAGMHWQCYADWKYQARFAKQYFDAVANPHYKNPYWPTVLALPEIHINANCELEPPVADVHLQAIGPGIRVDVSQWEKWLAGGFRDQCVHSLQLSAYSAAVSRIQSELPTSQSVKDAFTAAKEAT